MAAGDLYKQGYKKNKERIRSNDLGKDIVVSLKNAVTGKSIISDTTSKDEKGSLKKSNTTKKDKPGSKAEAFRRRLGGR